MNFANILLSEKHQIQRNSVVLSVRKVTVETTRCFLDYPNISRFLKVTQKKVTFLDHWVKYILLDKIWSRVVDLYPKDNCALVRWLGGKKDYNYIFMSYCVGSNLYSTIIHYSDLGWVSYILYVPINLYVKEMITFIG